MISVCLATHNGEKYIKEQIDSILSQLSDSDELIISDDGSTDSTLDIIKAYNDHRIHIFNINHPVTIKRAHARVAKNFENALRHANGNFIFLSDQDDVWYPNKVELCLKALDGNKYYAVLHNLECVNGELKPLGYNWYNDNNKFRFLNLLMLKGKHMGCALLIKRDLLRLILPFPKQLVLHDFWIGLLAELYGGIIFIKNPLIKYRLHNNNTSGGKNNNTLIFKLIYRIYTMYYILVRYIKYKLTYLRIDN